METRPFKIHLLPASSKPHRKPTPTQLQMCRKFSVPFKGVLNPYGCIGSHVSDDRDHLALRPEAMKRRRLKINSFKFSRALEAHELQKIAREAAEAAMSTLEEICKDKRAPQASRIAASAVILDRGYGKASQTSITANVTNGKARDITSDELDKRVNSALDRVEELTNRAPKEGPSAEGPSDLRKYN